MKKTILFIVHLFSAFWIYSLLGRLEESLRKIDFYLLLYFRCLKTRGMDDVSVIDNKSKIEPKILLTFFKNFLVHCIAPEGMCVIADIKYYGNVQNLKIFPFCKQSIKRERLRGMYFFLC